MAYRCRALKLELPGVEGGGQTDFGPTDTNPNQDGLDARAYFVQNGASADSAAYLSRAQGGADLTLTDANAGTKLAQDLVSRVRGATASHQGLADAIHFLDDGPGDGWASGASCTVAYNGILPISRTWYAAGTTTPIVSLNYDYQPSKPILASKTWRIYNGASVAVTVVDTLSYAGPVVASIKRTWS